MRSMLLLLLLLLLLSLLYCVQITGAFIHHHHASSSLVFPLHSTQKRSSSLLLSSLLSASPLTSTRSIITTAGRRRRIAAARSKWKSEVVLHMSSSESSAASTNCTTTTTPTSLNQTSAVTAVSSSETKKVPALTQQQRPLYRECLAFVIPALGIYACPSVMSLIDAAFLPSTLELAALGPASAISDSAALPFIFVSIAATNLIAQAYATQDTQQLQKITHTAITVGLLGGAVLALLFVTCAAPISSLYCGGGSSGGALTYYCTQYVAIRAFALPAVVTATIAQAISIGTKDTTTPMLSVIVAGCTNFVGDLLLVSWLKMGISGAAIATAVSQFVCAGLLLRNLFRRGYLSTTMYNTFFTSCMAIIRKKRSNNRNTKSSSSSSSSSLLSDETAMTTGATATSTTTTTSTMDVLKQIVSFVPFLYVTSVKVGWHNSCTATAASLGRAEAAAHTGLLAVGMVCFTLGDVGSSLAQAFLPTFMETATVVNENTNTNTNTNNEQDNINNNTRSTTTITKFDFEAALPTIRRLLSCTIGISTTVVGLASLIIGLFGTRISNDPHVLREMKRTLPLMMTAISFHGSAVTLEGMLLARKKLRGLTLWYTVLAITVVGFQVCTRRYHWGLTGVWGCYIWFCASRVVVFSVLGGLIRPKQWWSKIRSATNNKHPVTKEA